MSSSDASGIVQYNLGFFDSHKEWAWIPKNDVLRYMLLVPPGYEAAIGAGEGHVCFWTNLTQVN